uniref:Uncharacterized protein n=1 Tax=Schizaphis graminum TaxID=13262 RepID=A0A2S2NZQ4_SCHGA
MLNGNKRPRVDDPAFLVVVYLCIYILLITEVFLIGIITIIILLCLLSSARRCRYKPDRRRDYSLPNDVAARTIQTRYRNYKCVYSIYAVHARARACVCV